MKPQAQVSRRQLVKRLDGEWRIHLINKDYPAAIGVIVKLIELEPNDYVWHHAHGYLLDQLHRLPEALQAYMKANKLNPSDSEHQLCIAMVLKQLKRYKEALEYVESAIKLDPNEARAYLYKATCLRMLGDCQPALVAVERAILLEPNNGENYCEKGAILGRLKDFDAAVIACTTALDQAATIGLEILVQTYTNRGSARLILSMKDEALNDFEQALKLKADDPTALAMRAHCFLKSEKYPDALAAIDLALKIYPTNPFMNALRGSILLRAQQYEQALLQLTLTYIQLELDKTILHVLHSDRAEVLLALERYEEARIAINQSIALEENDSVTLQIQEKILRALGRETEAEEVKNLIQTLPNRYFAYLSSDNAILPPAGVPSEAINNQSYLEWFNQGVLLNRQQQPEEALKAFERAIELNPNYANAHFNRAALLHGFKRYDEALAAYQEAARCAPKNADAHLYSGNLLMRAERFDAAIDTYTTFLALEPANKEEGFVRRADAYIKSGNYTEARADCEAALERVGNTPKIQERCDRLLAKISEECPTYCP